MFCLTDPLAYLVAFLIGSRLDTAFLKILFIFLILGHIAISKKAEIKYDSLKFYFLILIVIGIINTGFYLAGTEISPHEKTNIFLRCRFYAIEIGFAIAVLIYLQGKTLRHIIWILAIGVMLNLCAGIVQFCLSPSERIRMLFPEPHGAGYYYCFIFFIAWYKMNISKTIKIFSKVFVFFGLLIGSKTQFFAIALVLFIRCKNWLKIGIGIIIVLVICYFSAPILEKNIVLYQAVLTANSLQKKGIVGLSTKSGIYGTWITRFSGIYVALKAIGSHPFGIGFGSFNSYFVNYMEISGLNAFVTGAEVDKIYQGVYYATPKSYLLELFVSTGIWGIAIYILIFLKVRKVTRCSKRANYLYYSFLSLTFVSAFSELAPFYTYIAIIMVLLQKEQQYMLEETNSLVGKPIVSAYIADQKGLS